MADHRGAKQCSSIISVSLFGRDIPSNMSLLLMDISFIQYSLMTSPENINLDKTKLKNLINFKFKF